MTGLRSLYLWTNSADLSKCKVFACLVCMDSECRVYACGIRRRAMSPYKAYSRVSALDDGGVAGVSMPKRDSEISIGFQQRWIQRFKGFQTDIFLSLGLLRYVPVPMAQECE